MLHDNRFSEPVQQIIFLRSDYPDVIMRDNFPPPLYLDTEENVPSGPAPLGQCPIILILHWLMSLEWCLSLLLQSYTSICSKTLKSCINRQREGGVTVLESVSDSLLSTLPSLTWKRQGLSKENRLCGHSHFHLVCTIPITRTKTRSLMQTALSNPRPVVTDSHWGLHIPWEHAEKKVEQQLNISFYAASFHRQIHMLQMCSGQKECSGSNLIFWQTIKLI